MLARMFGSSFLAGTRTDSLGNVFKTPVRPRRRRVRRLVTAMRTDNPERKTSPYAPISSKPLKRSSPAF